ncbi:TorD/DmsD family molecular chaperone [Mesobacillus maritimus]|uniref:Molecular chaperone TorD family protein n=1 Tax=Mesobacillus maritimus TaxID=1643336 RepID=A0ABS7K1A0_9BACI|nr:molecular chaperone TorD family protein [Mesobacillus maritimus]MBY0096033.1 molecular chaperone TorD family protein [Mesobacillus maritimus]
MTAITEKEHTFGILFQTRSIMNEVVRFILNRSPEKDSLYALKNNPTFQSLCEISDNASVISKSIDSLLLGPKSMQDAKDEYTRLFVGPHALPAPLWESVYLGREHLLFNEQTLQVRKCYQQYGLYINNENNEPEDHIVLELEFMSYLTQEIFESDDDADTKKLIEDHTYFLNEHLGRWAPTFCEKLIHSTKSPLFQGAAFLLSEYIELEHQVANFLCEVMTQTATGESFE